MFGFSLSELIVVIVVALVVVGPRDLPKMLRKLGGWAGKLRRMAADLRHQSGIDDALRSEGLADDIAEIRKLARGELDAVQRAAVLDERPRPGAMAPVPMASTYSDDFVVSRDREFPRDGADSYGALPDTAIVYVEGMPRSALARDPLYMTGDENGVVPEPPPPPFSDDEADLGGGDEQAAAATVASDAGSTGDGDNAGNAGDGDDAGPGDDRTETTTGDADPAVKDATGDGERPSARQATTEARG